MLPSRPIHVVINGNISFFFFLISLYLFKFPLPFSAFSLSETSLCIYRFFSFYPLRLHLFCHILVSLVYILVIALALLFSSLLIIPSAIFSLLFSQNIEFLMSILHFLFFEIHFGTVYIFS